MRNVTVTIKGLEITASARDTAELINLLADAPVERPAPVSAFAAIDDKVRLPKQRAGEFVTYKAERYYIVGQDMHARHYLLAQPGEGLKVELKIPFSEID